MFDDLPPDLERLLTLRLWHAMWVQRIDAKIAAVQRRQAEEEHGRRTRPQPPEWIVELGISAGWPPVEVHAGNCYMAGKRRRTVDRDEARRLLAAGLRACSHCQPDTQLNILDLATPHTARARLEQACHSGGYPSVEVTGVRHPEQDPRCRLPHHRSPNRTHPHSPAPVTRSASVPGASARHTGTAAAAHPCAGGAWHP